MSHTPFFSVIIPTRNRPVEFEVALDSVLRQTCRSFEVIVVNDGTSTQWQEQYTQLKSCKEGDIYHIDLMERSRGHGHCFARNQGADIARGEFICFLDDDDWWTDSEFLSRAQIALTEEGADFYFANQKAITRDGKEINNVWVEDLPSKLSSSDPRLLQTVFEVQPQELLLCQGFPHQNCWAIKTSLYKAINGMDENLRYEPDRDIYLRALDAAEKVLYDKTVVSLHNVPDKNLANNASTQTNVLEKLLFQLRTIDKAILFSKRFCIIKFAQKRKGYLLKKITEILLSQKDYKKACFYSKEALATSPTIKWFGFTVYCYFLLLTKG